MTKNELWELRKQVRLCSIYTSDFENTFGIEKHSCQDFFDGYAEELEYIMQNTIENFKDSKYFDYLKDFDNADNLYDYYYGIENPFVYKNTFENNMGIVS